MVGAFRLPSGTTTTTGGATATPWVRPSDWLAMPTPGTQEIIGLLAIFDDANYIALQCQGAYTVDWGDGTTTNYSTNAIASKTYAYSSISAATTTSRGYRQVLVRITPQAGQNLSSAAFNVQHPSLAKAYTTGWLDFDVRMPLGTPYWNGHTNIVRYHRIERVVVRDIIAGSLMGNMFNTMTNLQSVYVEPTKTATSTNFNGMFTNCYALEEAPFMNTAAGTSFNSMFAQCYNLKVVPQYNFQSATSFDTTFGVCRSLESIPLFNIGNGPNITMANMFNECTDLKTVPLLNMAGVTNTNSMFANCRSLQSIPLLNISNVTNTGAMFSTCQSLTTIPLLNTSKSTNMNTMFFGCQSMTTIPLLDTGKCTNFNSMFASCQALEYIPLINTELGIDFTNMLSSCPSLRDVPLLNTGSASNFSSIFLGCTQLQAIPAFNTSKVSNWTNAFSTCLALRSLPTLDFSAGTNFTSFLNGNASLGRSGAFGGRFAHSYTNMALAQSEIVNIFTNLGTASGAQAITVSSNPGYATLTAAERLIATNRGWTIA